MLLTMWDVGGVQPLLPRAQAQSLDGPVRGSQKATPATVVFHQTHPKVVQRLLR